MIINNHITNKQVAEDILQKELTDHKTSVCDCVEQNGVVYPCRASGWLNGNVPSKHVIENQFE